MAIVPISELPIEGRRVFLRVDFNTPLTDVGGEKKVADDSRIQASLPTIRHCLERGARLVLASHLGRPKGAPKPEFSLEPVASHLASLLDTDVILTDEPVGDGARKVIGDLRSGQIALLENLRFHPGEEKNDETFAAALASYADVYVNDAFGAAHRAHASTVGIARLVGSKGAGFLLLEEVKALSRLLRDVERPYVAILGGAKVSDKIDVLLALLDRVNTILIGGAMANTFLGASGLAVGASLAEEDKAPQARNFLRRAKDNGVEIVLPVDALVAASPSATDGQVHDVTDIPETGMMLDIGPRTIKQFQLRIELARTIFWNGPMGVFENEPFARGTLEVAKSVAGQRLAFTVVGGGDSVAALSAAGLTCRIGHVSTGGGASLEFVQGLTLPGIAALETAA